MNNNPAFPKLVIVDDDEDDVLLARRALAVGFENCDVVHMANGQELLSLLRGMGADQKPTPLPDLVFLDLNMPILDGRSTLAQLKGDAALRGIPVVVFSSSDDPGEVDSAYNLGANSFVQKPSSLEAYTEAVCKIANYWLHYVQLPNRGRLL